MLWIFASVLVVLWALGLATSYTVGGFIHLLIVLAVALVVARVIRGPGQTGPGQPKRSIR